MATFIISGSRGTDDPTMATLPFMAVKVAKEQGHDVVLWLWKKQWRWDGRVSPIM